MPGRERTTRPGTDWILDPEHLAKHPAKIRSKGMGVFAFSPAKRRKRIRSRAQPRAVFIACARHHAMSQWDRRTPT
jgi:hypothetical protein